MKPVLITGITGFVGTSLVRFFRGNGSINLYGHSRDLKKAQEVFANDKIKFISELTAKEFDRAGIETIIHLAGIAHDLSGRFTSQDYQEVNFRQTVKLYDEFFRSEVRRFVFISSIKAVIDHSNEIISENAIPNPQSPYGKSKRKAELYINENIIDGKEVFILRPCMIHGPGNKGNLNLLFALIKRGIPYPLGAFENNRSFLSIDNFNFVIDKILNGKLRSGDYLLSDTKPVSTKEIVHMIGAETSRPAKILNLPVSMVRFAAKMGTLMNAKFNLASLKKLTGNMVVSNSKLIEQLGEELPVGAEEGLLKTIRSFNE